MEFSYLDDYWDLYEEVYFRVKLNGEVSFVSPAVFQVLGLTPDELAGNDVTNYYLYSNKSKNLLRSIVTERSTKIFELSLVHKKGKIIPVKVRARLKKYDRWYIEGVVANRINEAKLKESLQRTQRVAEESKVVKEEFLANMSHEIRTPLNGVIGMTNVLSATDLDRGQKEKVEAIKKSSQILLSLLNNILDWSKLEAGKMSIYLEQVETRSILDNVVNVYKQNALEKGLTIKVKIPDNIPAFIITDHLKIMQVYSNLVSNSIKFSNEGGEIILTLEVEKKEGNNLLMAASVKDEGIGIIEEEQDLLFTSFTQMESTTKKRYEGAGLGLSISKAIINLLGGEIKVKSIPGDGSVFSFTFLAEEAKDVTTERVIRDSPFIAKPHILVVDDNKVNLEVASQLLVSSGAIVKNASSAREAIGLLKSNFFDGVFLDIQMPSMSGLELLEWMKGNLEVLPEVIALTAFSNQDDKEKFLAQGFQDYLAKPLNPERLEKKVRDLKANKNQIIDRRVIENLIKYGDRQMVNDAFSDFIKETEEQIEDCFVSLSEQNEKNILDTLHTMKGNAGTLGVRRLAEKAKNIEEQLQKGYVINIEEHLKMLAYYFKEFKVHYKKF